jgi:Ca2+-binding RTX toxin-like protein
LLSIEYVIGSNFSDSITGNATNNNLSGGQGDDTLNGSVGNDTINGGTGNDTSFYSSANAAVTVNLTLGTATGGDGSDVLISIENVIGSNFSDTITGDAANNNLRGGGGHDVFFGTAGNDTINGEVGNDAARYTKLDAVVTLGAFGVLNKGALGTDILIAIESIVGSNLLGDTIDHSGASVAPAAGTVTNLTTGVVTIKGSDPLPLTFTVLQFENVIGSNFADLITGNAANNNLSGGQGDDILDGGAGNDTINGGTGNDTADYSSDTAVEVNLTSGTATSAAGSDVLLSIENVIGSARNDIITGNAANNGLRGGARKDTLTGAGGNDIFDYTSLSDSLLDIYDVITDYSHGDILDRPGSSSTLLNLSIGTAAGLSAAQVGSILNPFSFAASSSVAFTAIGFSGTFIALNDAIAGFNAATDSIVHLVAYNISSANVVNIA